MHIVHSVGRRTLLVVSAVVALAILPSVASATPLNRPAAQTHEEAVARDVAAETEARHVPDLSPLEDRGPDTSDPAEISPLATQTDGWRDS